MLRAAHHPLHLHQSVQVHSSFAALSVEPLLLLLEPLLRSLLPLLLLLLHLLQEQQFEG